MSSFDSSEEVDHGLLRTSTPWVNLETSWFFSGVDVVASSCLILLSPSSSNGGGESGGGEREQEF